MYPAGTGRSEPVDIPPFLTPHGGDCVLEVFVQPRAAKQAVVGIHGTALKVRVTAPPVDNRANRAVEALIAGLLGVPKGRVTVVAGHSSRHKRLEIEGVAASVAAGVLGVPPP